MRPSFPRSAVARSPCLSNDFADGPDDDLAPGELNYDTTPRSGPTALQNSTGMLRRPDSETRPLAGFMADTPWLTRGVL